jgi:hypothetical protein
MAKSIHEIITSVVKKSKKTGSTKEYCDALSDVYSTHQSLEKRDVDDKFFNESIALLKKLGDSSGVSRAVILTKLTKLYQDNVEHWPFPIGNLFGLQNLGYDYAPSTADRYFMKQVKIMRRDGEKAFRQELMAEFAKPIKENRLWGTSFEDFIELLKIKGIRQVRTSEEFENSENAIFVGNDFARSDLFEKVYGVKTWTSHFKKARSKKRFDLCFKVGNVLVVGEAKYVSNCGGEQNHNIDDALEFVAPSYKSPLKPGTTIVPIAIIDGPGVYNNLCKSKSVVKRIDKAVSAGSNVISVFEVKTLVGRLINRQEAIKRHNSNKHGKK